jgi:hypothetical protein
MMMTGSLLVVLSLDVDWRTITTAAVGSTESVERMKFTNSATVDDDDDDVDDCRGRP